MAAQPFSPMLTGLPYLGRFETRSISGENPTGGKGMAAMAEPDPAIPVPRSPHLLGRGWKAHPFAALPAGETVTLADIEGPGTITHFFITSSAEEYRPLVLRMWWDDEERPSVESPLGDFFAAGHEDPEQLVSSIPIVVAPTRGMNSYWPMPFRHRARITLTNESAVDAGIVAFNITYTRHDVPDDAAYFHAQWRRSTTRREHPEHTILDGVRGAGHYVGTSIAWTSVWRGWWGEGEVKFYLDGDTEFPTIAGNGTEDHFGGAWCFSPPGTTTERTFSTPFLGLPYADTPGSGGRRRFGMYRWHVLDPIGFLEDIRVTVQALGGDSEWVHEPLTDDLASLAVWYQTEPHAGFPALPSLRERREKISPEASPAP